MTSCPDDLHIEIDLKDDAAGVQTGEMDRLRIIERTGIGSADAMIVNLFIQSKYAFIVSGDADIKFAMDRLKPKDKSIVTP